LIHVNLLLIIGRTIISCVHSPTSSDVVSRAKTWHYCPSAFVIFSSRLTRYLLPDDKETAEIARAFRANRPWRTTCV